MDNQNTQHVSFNSNSRSPKSSSSLEGGESSMSLPAIFFTETSGDQFEWQRQFILVEIQRLIESCNDAFCQLHHTICYVESLKKENLFLESEKLKLIFAVQEQERSSASPLPEIPPSSSTIVAGFDGTFRHANLEVERSDEAITDGEADTGESILNPQPNVLPKSISIRSSGFVAARHLSSRSSEMSSTSGYHPLRLQLPAASPLQNDGVVKVEAYSQGTTKTELCNKWGEMGMCPYAEDCHFAHGIEELRPVIRHPRYKTQLCRMLTNGGGCPYGHRCHFRHAALPAFNDR